MGGQEGSNFLTNLGHGHSDKKKKVLPKLSTHSSSDQQYEQDSAAPMSNDSMRTRHNVWTPKIYLATKQWPALLSSVFVVIVLFPTLFVCFLAYVLVFVFCSLDFTAFFSFVFTYFCHLAFTWFALFLTAI